MSAAAHVCYWNGALVSASGVIPDDRADYLWSAGLTEVGCNHIACSACGREVVANAPGQDGGRHYACACRDMTVHGRRLLAGEHEDRPDGPVPATWGCAAHPPRALPAVLDGLTVEASPDWAAWAAKSARGELSPVGAPSWLPRRKHTWLERLVATVSETERERFAATVVALLDGGEGAGVALDLAQRLGLAKVAAEVIARVARGAVDWNADPARTKAIVGLLEKSWFPPGEDAEWIEASRAALLNAPNTSGMMYLLAKRDAAWLAEHAAEVVRANPEFAGRLSSALETDAPDQLPVARARLQESGE